MRYLLIILFIASGLYGQVSSYYELTADDVKQRVWRISMSYDEQHYDSIWAGQFYDLGVANDLTVVSDIVATDDLTAGDDLIVTDDADIGGNITLENDEIISNSDDGDINLWFNDDATTLGQLFLISSIDSPNVADNDKFEIGFLANDDSSGLDQFATIEAIFLDVTDETEDSEIRFNTYFGGTEKEPLKVTGDCISVDSASVVGVGTFTTTETADTVLITGALSTDLYFLTGRGGSVDQQDVLQAEAKADTLIVHRIAAGASGLSYNWMRMRYHN